MLAAAKLVNELSAAYVNFFPLFNEDFEGRLGTDHEGYCKKLVSAVRETGLKMLSYDCYDQCFEVDREIGINQYFRNLNAFSRLAKECGVPLWTCLLSVGHWCYRVPTEDDLRWQLSTAAAHGAKGVMWFYLYQRYLESSYRNSPFDLYYRRTETFDRLARQNRIFLEHYAGRLCQAEPVRIFHYRTAYGGTPLYHEGCIDGLTLSEKYGTPLIISQFEDRDGQFLVLVNNSQTVSAKVSGRYGEKAIDEWLAPGQTGMITEPDDTLTNQEGYTDEELAAREANQGTGCNSAAIGGANGGAGMLATVLLLLSSAALAVRRSRTLGK